MEKLCVLSEIKTGSPLNTSHKRYILLKTTCLVPEDCGLHIYHHKVLEPHIAIYDHSEIREK